VKVEAGQARLELDAAGGAGEALNFLDVSARVSPPAGESFEAKLTQNASGSYAADFDLAEEGVYLARIEGRDEKGVLVGSRTAGFVVPYSPEYSDPEESPTDPRLFRLAEATGGRVIDAPERVFDPVDGIMASTEIWSWFLFLAALLFPIDVGLRKVRVGRKDLLALRERLRLSLRPAKAGDQASRPQEKALGMLFEAKKRAAGRRSATGGAGRPAQGQAASVSRATPLGDVARSGGAGPGSSPDAAPTSPPAEPSPNELQPEPPSSSSQDTLARLRKAKGRARRR